MSTTKQAYRSILSSLTNVTSGIADTISAASKYSQLLDNRAELDIELQAVRHKVKRATYEDDHIEEVLVEKFKRQQELNKMLTKSGDEENYNKLKSEFLKKLNE